MGYSYTCSMYCGDRVIHDVCIVGNTVIHDTVIYIVCIVGHSYTCRMSCGIQLYM